MIADRGSLWFGHGKEEQLFYPFGIKGKGYSVPVDQHRRIVVWTQWRAHLPLVLITIFFLPAIGFWGPTLSASGRLEAGTLALSTVVVLVAALASAWFVDRAAYAWLLRGCSALDRMPTRAERKASSGQVTQSFANRNFAPLPIRLLCLTVGLATIILGLANGDLWMMLSGLLLAALFALDVLKDSCNRVHVWLLNDFANMKRDDP
ncbi:hypothetical protein [uncultured Rhodoblastus sp.]|uniref:hypothetical protein n=1 Tax=uncultured Rhodoblastus sp. TaxID=543037 RepID=UPI0025F0D2FC|nr:hypothetical protein [uncultured Rhodoblastus sp.]